MVSQTGDVKRVPKSSFRTQRRNGKGIKSEEDAILTTIKTNCFRGCSGIAGFISSHNLKTCLPDCSDVIFFCYT